MCKCISFAETKGPARETINENPNPLQLRSCREDIDPSALPVKRHVAVGDGEEGVVLGPPDVATGVELGAVLADDDAAGSDELAAVGLDAESLSVGVAPVLGRPLPFFV